MQFTVLTLFPELITHYCGATILGRGQKNKSIAVRTVQIRDFATDKHKTVDDTPCGGGAGMVMKPEPIYAALKSIDGLPFRKASGLTKLKRIANGSIRKKKRTILMSPRGRQFDQRLAEEWSAYDELIIICGRYEGVDQRVVDHMIDEEVSIGPYVLAGGELGALTIVEAVARLIPGVLGNPESLLEETHGLKKTGMHAEKKSDGVSTVADLEAAAEYPQYTKPADFMGWKVPEVLLGGNHKKIDEWRREESKKRTKNG